MAIDPQIDKSRLAQQGFDAVCKFLRTGDEVNGIAPLAPDLARRVAAQSMLAIMGAGLTFEQSLLDRTKLTVKLGPETTAEIEIRGPVVKSEVQRLKKHIDLMMEALPE